MMGYEAFVAAYTDEGGAHYALHTLEDMDNAGSIFVSIRVSVSSWQ